MKWKQLLNIRKRYLIIIIVIVLLLLFIQIGFKINKQNLTETVWVPHEYVDSSTGELVNVSIPQDIILQEFNEVYISFDDPLGKASNFLIPCSVYQNIKIGQILLTAGEECFGAKNELKFMGISQYHYYYVCYGIVSSEVATCMY